MTIRDVIEGIANRVAEESKWGPIGYDIMIQRLTRFAAAVVKSEREQRVARLRSTCRGRAEED